MILISQSTLSLFLVSETRMMFYLLVLNTRLFKHPPATLPHHLSPGSGFSCLGSLAHHNHSDSFWLINSKVLTTIALTWFLNRFSDVLTQLIQVNGLVMFDIIPTIGLMAVTAISTPFSYDFGYLYPYMH